jgi:DNA-binding Lrp family transcriptional regulator
VLARDARTSPTEIAIQTGLTVEQVEQAISEMESAGIIRRYKTVIDWEKFGEERVFAFIDVSVTPARDKGFDDIAVRISRYPEVHSVYLVSGSQDLRCVVEGRSLQQVADFVARKLAPLDRVTGTATHFLLKKYKDDGDIFYEEEEDSRLRVSP